MKKKKENYLLGVKQLSKRKEKKFCKKRNVNLFSVNTKINFLPKKIKYTLFDISSSYLD